MYVGGYPKVNDGRTPYTLTLRDVPVDGFWSISVYNDKGFFEKNPKTCIRSTASRRNWTRAFAGSRRRRVRVHAHAVAIHADAAVDEVADAELTHGAGDIVFVAIQGVPAQEPERRQL